jgi:hypothetical protein
MGNHHEDKLDEEQKQLIRQSLDEYLKPYLRA